MKMFVIAVIVTAVIGGGLAALFAGHQGGEGQASAALALAPEGPAAGATAIAIKTPTASTGGGSTGGGSSSAGSDLPGKQIATTAGCAACHSTGGASGVGPTWKGMFGHQVTLADGSTVTADEAYLRESVTNPDAKIVKGFNAGIMPKNFGTSLTPDQINQLVEYMKALQ